RLRCALSCAGRRTPGGSDRPGTCTAASRTGSGSRPSRATPAGRGTSRFPGDAPAPAPPRASSIEEGEPKRAASHRPPEDALVGRARFRLARLQNAVDRLDEEFTHDPIVDDEDHHDREQRVIGRQTDLHCSWGREKQRRADTTPLPEAAVVYHNRVVGCQLSV